MTALDRLRDLGEGALELVCPTRCVGCNMPGELVCGGCRSDLSWICQQWACPRCGSPCGWLTCTGCGRDGDEWEMAATICALGFDAISSQLITVYKDQHELRLAPVIAAAIACALDEAAGCADVQGCARFDRASTDAVCFVPATRAAYARRGFDHMEIVSRELASILGVPFYDVLARDDARDQRELGKRERGENLAGTVGVVGDVGGLSLLVVDDVITTGSTIREAARTLLARGAAEVRACSLARVW